MSSPADNHVEVAEGSLPYKAADEPGIEIFEGIYQPKPSIPGSLFFSKLMPFEYEVKARIMHFHHLPGLQPYCWIPGSPDIKTLLDSNTTPDKYMKQPKPGLKGSGSAGADLQWIHLPANNMSWVEQLMIALFGEAEITISDSTFLKNDPSSSSKGKAKTISQESMSRKSSASWLLRDQHWRSCQSKLNSQTAHGLFMQPLYSEISPYPSSDGIFSGASEDKNSVTFMPFLHWDTKDNYVRRNKCLDWMYKSTAKSRNEGIGGGANLRTDGEKIKAKNTAADATMTLRTRKDIPWDKIEQFPLYDKLLLAYVNEESPLHVRQTLDQSFYYNLDEMEIRERDLDQVLYRYFKRQNLEKSLRLLMVDQLWLWDLHPPNQPHTIVTAFPTRIGFPGVHPNIESDRSDILWRIQQALDKPSPAISSANDLICLIIDKASSLFHPQSDETDHLLPGYYETFASSIADLSVKSTKLSDAMAHSAKRLVKLQERKRDVLNASLREGWFTSRNAESSKSDNHTVAQDGVLSSIPFSNVSAAALSPSSADGDINKWFETPETPPDDPLSSVKDILNQHSVLKIESAIDQEMSTLINISKETSLLREVKDVLDELNSICHVYMEQIKVVKSMLQTSRENTIPFQGDTQDSKDIKDEQIMMTIPSIEVDDSVEEYTDLENRPLQDINNKGLMGLEGQSSGTDEKRVKKGKDPIGDEDIHGATRQQFKHHYEDLLHLIMNRKRDIDSLSNEARRVYNSLCDLLDLKQKQASVVEAYAARQEAKETAQQGRILLVFTIVTIVFLPLSFIASIFSMNAREINGWNRPAWQIMAIMWPTATFIFVISLMLAYINSVQWFFSGLKSFIGKSVTTFLSQRHAQKAECDQERKRNQRMEHQPTGNDSQTKDDQQGENRTKTDIELQNPINTGQESKAREGMGGQTDNAAESSENAQTEKVLTGTAVCSRWRVMISRLCNSSSTAKGDSYSQA